MQRTVDVAIIGAAFSGSLLAIQILRRNAGARIFLIEKASHFGRGVAYGAADPEHLLNVRASNMSAFPDEPNHFVDWLRSNAGPGVEPRAFVSRQLFGTYLQAMLRDIVETEEGAGRLVAVPDEAVAVTLDGPRPRVELAVGRVLEVDHIVLASGNLPPRDLPPFVEVDSPAYTRDPWRENAFADLAPASSVLLLGTGLTAVDMALKLKAAGHTGAIHAISRRGLRPNRHHDYGPNAAELPLPSHPSLTALVRLVRASAREKGWRETVDAVRPNVQTLWCEASDAQRRRFLRHLRPWWDVHRHRLAPTIADKVQSMESSGQLRFYAGRVQGVRFFDEAAEVAWMPRGTQASQTLRIDRIVNCTGPAGDVSKAGSPLFRDLLQRGLARPDICRLGLDVDLDCRLINVRGEAQDQLRAIGPISRGAFWEIVAVPDIRVQAARVASLVATP